MSKDALRAHRKALVKGAEGVMEAYFANKYGGFDQRGRPQVAKTQLSQLIGVCGEAACPEEIINYLRYQVGRPQASWTDALVEALRKPVAQVTDALPDDELRVQAWQRYTTYLSRAFTYQDAILKDRDAAAKGGRR